MARIQKFDNKIGAEWRGGNHLANVNPSDTADEIGLFAGATVEDTRDAFAAAEAAFPAWFATTLTSA